MYRFDTRAIYVQIAIFFSISLLIQDLNAQSFSLSLGEVIDKKTARDNFDPITPSGFLFDLVGIYRESHHTLFDPSANLAFMGTSYTGGKYYRVGVLKDFHTLSEVVKLSAEFQEESKRKVFFEAFAHIEGRNFGIYGVEYPERDEYQIYVNELDDRMILLGSPIKVATIKEVKAKGKNYFVLSSPEQKQFVICRVIDTKKNQLQSLECTMLNSDFSVRWKKDFTLTSKDKDVTLQDIQIDDMGNLYILALQHPARYEDVPVFYSYIFSADKFTENALGKAGQHIYGAKFFIPEGSDSTVVCGLHSNKNNHGFFVYDVNQKTGQLTEVVYSLLSEETKSHIRPDHPSRAGSAVKSLVKLNSGLYVLSIEQNFTVVGSSHNTYYSNSICLVAFSQGEIKWEKVINKRQGGSLNYSVNGHVLMNAGKKLLVLYNDDPDNAKIKLDSKDVEAYKGLKGAVFVAEFDELGNGKKYKLLTESADDNFVLKTKEVFKIKDSLYQLRLVFRSFMTSGDAQYRYATIAFEKEI
jgi:hypothetical protein